MTNGVVPAMRFGVYEADLHAGELRKNGRKIRIQEQPFRILAALLERPGELVTRDALRERLWPGRTFVEFDHGLTVAIGKLRDALGDSADNPVFIETLPRRGYGFIAPVEKPDGSSYYALAGLPRDSSRQSTSPVASVPGIHRALRWAGAIFVAASLGGGIYVAGHMAPAHLRLPPSRIMLAVLPFTNLSGDAGQDYLNDAMTEELITHLGRLDPDALGVIARTSVMRFKNSASDVKQIARELGVAYVLEGSVHRGNAEIDVTGKLIRAGDQTLLWAETYERPLTDVFSIERDVTLKIAQSLALRLVPKREAVLARAGTLDTTAYDDYVRGSSALREGTEAGFRQALDCYQQALNHDPGFAMAYAGLGKTHFLLGDYHFESAAESASKAEAAVTQGLAADPSIPELYVLRAGLLSRRSPPQPIEEAYRRAIELNPSDADAHVEYALFLRGAGRMDEARREIESALVLDPLSPHVHLVAGWVSISADRLDDARSHLERALQLEPQFPSAMYFLGRVDERRNRFDSAIQWFEKSVAASGRTPKYLHALGIAYARAGRRDDALKLFEELRGQSKNRYVDPDYLSSLQTILNLN